MSDLVTPTQSKSVIPEEALFKNRLQEYAQKAAIPLPIYHTINEGTQHMPMFRATVVINGTTYTSPNVFLHRKTAEMDAARIALPNLAPQIDKENFSSLTLEVVAWQFNCDNFICKSILNEYAVKIHAGKPVYETKTLNGQPPTFVSSVAFDGKQYIGDVGSNKKKSHQLAARVAILSILDSDAHTAISKIINSKKRLYAAKGKVKYPSDAQNEVMPLNIQTQCNVGTSASKGYELKVVPSDNMPGEVIPEHCTENFAIISTKPTSLDEFRSPELEASLAEGLEANSSPIILVPLNLEQLVVDSTSTKKRRRRSKEAKNKVGIDAQVQIAAEPSSQTTICTVAQSVPNNRVSLQGFNNAVLSGPCVLSKGGSRSVTHFLVYWRKPTEGFIALNTHGALQSGIAAGGGVLRNHFGDHISNFYSNYGKVSIHFAQSKAILDGLTICKELGYNKIQIQTDSAEAALWFHRHLTVTVPLDLQTIWTEIYKLQDTLSIKILHIYEEGNKLAELLSRQGTLYGGMGSINISLETSARYYLTADKMGMSYLRKLMK